MALLKHLGKFYILFLQFFLMLMNIITFDPSYSTTDCNIRISYAMILLSEQKMFYLELPAKIIPSFTSIFILTSVIWQADSFLLTVLTFGFVFVTILLLLCYQSTNCFGVSTLIKFYTKNCTFRGIKSWIIHGFSNYYSLIFISYFKLSFLKVSMQCFFHFIIFYSVFNSPFIYIK